MLALDTNKLRLNPRKYNLQAGKVPWGNSLNCVLPLLEVTK